MEFYYVYILQSESNPERFYTGHTDNLQNRLQIHNQKKCKHTLKHIPWKIKTAIAFADKEKAMEFEKYLKTASGRAFAKNDCKTFPVKLRLGRPVFYLRAFAFAKVTADKSADRKESADKIRLQ